MESPFDPLLSKPGLSRLATEIFLGVDLDTFGRLERVCRAWKGHFAANNLWKLKLMKETRPGSYARKIIEEATNKGVGDFDDLCRSLSRDLAWIRDEQLESKVIKRSYRVSVFSLVGTDKLLCAQGGRLFLRSADPSVAEDDVVVADCGAPAFDRCIDVAGTGVTDLSGVDQTGPVRMEIVGGWPVVVGDVGGIAVTCVDARGSRATVWCSAGSVAVWDWTVARRIDGVRGTPLVGATAVVRFAPDGDVVASVHSDNALRIWNFANDRLSLARVFMDSSPLFGPFVSASPYVPLDVSAGHVISAFDTRVHIVSRSRSSGDFALVCLKGVGSRVSSVLAMRSGEPGVDVGLTGDSAPSVKVWNLANGDVLREVGGVHAIPVSLTQCPGTGIVAMGFSSDGAAAAAVSLLSSAAVARGLTSVGPVMSVVANGDGNNAAGLRNKAAAAGNNLQGDATVAVMGAPGKIHVVRQDGLLQHWAAVTTKELTKV